MKKAAPKNIEVFNHAVLWVLIKLYDSFPVPIDIDSRDIVADGLPGFLEETEVINFSDIPEHTLTWLEKEGFLTVESKPLMGAAYYSKARLTLKGLTLLGYTPSSVIGSKGNDKLINIAKSVLVKATEQSASDVVGSLFTAAVQILTRI